MNIFVYLPLARCSIDKMADTALMVGIMLAHLVDRRQQIDPLGYYLSVQEVKLHSKLHRLLGKHSEKRRIMKIKLYEWFWVVCCLSVNLNCIFHT